MSRTLAIRLGIGVIVLGVLVVGVLIAIPIIRRAQPPHGWSDQVQSSLKNAAIAEESYCTTSPKCYTSSLKNLKQEGLKVHSAVELTVVSATETGFCIEGRHDELPGEVWFIDRREGTPREGACPTR